METTEPGLVGGQNRARRPFPHYHRADRSFFLLFIALCWLGVVMGFMPAVTKRLAGEADYAAPPVLQTHIVAFTAWLLLLTAQVVLIRAGRTSVHKKLGLAGVVLIPIMAITALLAEVYSQRFYFDHPPNSQAFFIVPISYALAFAGLASAALLQRRNSSAHKRLIVLATTVIVGAAYARWWGEGLTQRYGDGLWGMILNTYLGTNLLLAGAVSYDLLTRRRIHLVYAVGVPAMLLGELAVSFVYHAPGWLPIARALIGR